MTTTAIAVFFSMVPYERASSAVPIQHKGTLDTDKIRQIYLLFVYNYDVLNRFSSTKTTTAIAVLKH